MIKTIAKATLAVNEVLQIKNQGYKMELGNDVFVL